jgi:type IV pilus assembly protein PilN
MIRINLLPFRAARKKENIRQQVSIFLLSAVFISVAMIYFNISLNGKIHNLNADIEKTKKDLDTYQKIRKEIADIRNRLTVLKKKTDVIKNLELNRKEPIHLLDAMTEMVVANRMWFTSFEKKEDLLNIEGVALDNKTVADFMTRLEGTKLFASVNLKTLKQKKLQNYNLNSFHIACKKVSL